MRRSWFGYWEAFALVALAAACGSASEAETDAATGECISNADCSHLDDGCTMGACDLDTGTCTALPSPNGTACGEQEVTDCEPCDFGDDLCIMEGTQTCTCTGSICESGECKQASGPTSCTQPCTREESTDGKSCGDTSITNCSDCSGFDEPCGEQGTKTCDCTVFTCLDETCMAATSPCEQNCPRDTDGDPCDSDVVNCGECIGNDHPVCDSQGTKTCTCRDFQCANGACKVASSESCDRSCSRGTTDGQVCGTACCGGSTCPKTRTTCCLNQQCGDLCGACE